MSKFIRLHSWKSDDVVLVKPEAVRAISFLPAYKCALTGAEGGARTRVDGEHEFQCWLVRETPDEIGKLIADAERGEPEL